MELIYTPYITFSPYNHQPIDIKLDRVFGYIVHGMSEFIHRDGLKYIPQYDKEKDILFNRPFEDYPEWLDADYWLHLRGLSCTSLIKPDGTLQICKAPNEKAYHAGISRWDKFSNLNSKFIGSEILMEGRNTYREMIQKFKTDWVKEEQYKTLAWEINKTQKEFKFVKENIIGHSDCAGDHVRGKGLGKEDPGGGFDWNKLWYYINKLNG